MEMLGRLAGERGWEKGTSRLGAAALGVEKEPQVSAAPFMLGLTGIY